MTSLRPTLVIALLAPFALTASGCGDGDSSTDAEAASRPTEETPLVEVRPAALAKVQRIIETTGYLESEHVVTVLSEVAGRIDSVHIDEGERVEAGREIVVLDKREAESAREQVQVQLDDRKVRADLAALDAEAAVRRVEQARIERDKAKAAYERNQAIDPGLISLAELDDSRFTYEASEESYRVAGFEQRKADLDVKAATNAIRELEAKLREQDLKIGDHTITAPIDGVVQDLHVRGGEAISSATELLVLVDDRNLVAYLRRPQRELPLVRDAREVVFRTDAWADRRFVAKIDVVSPVVDEATGNFRMRIRVADEDVEDLRPGMFLRAEILTEAERDALMVPKAAVLTAGDQSVVFVVRDGVARRVVLDPGLERRDAIECRNFGDDGIAPGDLVVVSGQQDLKDNTPVETTQTP